MRSQVQAGVGARVICLQRGRGMQARPAKVFFELCPFTCDAGMCKMREKPEVTLTNDAPGALTSFETP